MAAERRRGPGPRAQTWLAWAGAALGVGVVAFLVGRAGSEAGLPSPTPLPSAAGPLPITYGTALDPVSGEATQPADRFRDGDPLAYSVRMPAAPGVDTIVVEVIRLNPDGTETVAQPQSRGEQGIVATSPRLRLRGTDEHTPAGVGSGRLRDADLPARCVRTIRGRALHARRNTGGVLIEVASGFRRALGSELCPISDPDSPGSELVTRRHCTWRVPRPTPWWQPNCTGLPMSTVI